MSREIRSEEKHTLTARPVDGHTTRTVQTGETTSNADPQSNAVMSTNTTQV